MTAALDAYNERRKLEQARKRRPSRMPAEVRSAKVDGQPCRMCIGGTGDVEAHHLVPRSKFGSRDEAVHDPRNLIPLCKRHHTDHHTTARRVSRDVLTPDEIAFALDRQGPGWLDRWYPDAARCSS